jgi:hypothetical protein
LAIPLGVKYGVTDSYAQTYSLVSLKFEWTVLFFELRMYFCLKITQFRDVSTMNNSGHREVVTNVLIQNIFQNHPVVFLDRLVIGFKRRLKIDH